MPLNRDGVLDPSSATYGLGCTACTKRATRLIPEGTLRAVRLIVAPGADAQSEIATCMPLAKR